jgi:hypothetical protein
MDRHNRGLVQNDALRWRVDDGIDRAEIDSQILGEKTTEDIHDCLLRWSKSEPFQQPMCQLILDRQKLRTKRGKCTSSEMRAVEIDY